MEGGLARSRRSDGDRGGRMRRVELELVDDGTCRVRAAGATSAASTEKITLTVGLFGTFGYKEAGLYDAYQKLHPNITIQETSVEQENDYYAALQTHLAAGSGLSDVQGIEVGRIAEVVGTQADKFVDLKLLGAGDVSGTFYPWKWQAATTKDGAVDRPRHGHRPAGDLLPQGPLREGRPADRPRDARPEVVDVAEVRRLGKQYKAKAPEGPSSRTRPAASSTPSIGQSRGAVLRRVGQPHLQDEPGREERLGPAVQAATAGISREARAVRATGTRASRAARSRRSPARPG